MQGGGTQDGSETHTALCQSSRLIHTAPLRGRNPCPSQTGTQAHTSPGTQLLGQVGLAQAHPTQTAAAGHRHTHAGTGKHQSVLLASGSGHAEDTAGHVAPSTRGQNHDSRRDAVSGQPGLAGSQASSFGCNFQGSLAGWQPGQGTASTPREHGRATAAGRQGSQGPAALPLGSLKERQIPLKNAFPAKTFESRARARSRFSVESSFFSSHSRFFLLGGRRE